MLIIIMFLQIKSLVKLYGSIKSGFKTSFLHAITTWPYYLKVVTDSKRIEIPITENTIILIYF